MSLEINTAIARAAYEAERAYLLAIQDGRDLPKWEQLSDIARENECLRTIAYIRGGCWDWKTHADLASRGWEVWTGVVRVMFLALEKQ